MLKTKGKTEPEIKKETPEETEEKKRMGKISQTPEIEKLIDYLYVNGKTAYAIHKAVNKSGHKIAYRTVNSYLKNMSDKKKDEIEFLYGEKNLPKKKDRKKDRLISNITDTKAFLNELMDELNMKAASLSRSLDHFPDSKDAMALVKVTESMMSIQKELVNVNQNISTLKKDMVDEIFYRISEIFFQNILPMIPQGKRIEVASKMKEELEKLSGELLK